MVTKENIETLLRGVVHPETGRDIVGSAIVENINLSADSLSLSLMMPKSRDPFAISLKRAVTEVITAAYPELSNNLTVLIKEPSARKAEAKPEKKTTTGAIRRIIAIASGKGGVGKSTVTANLAVTLSKMGYKVGVLDADIYGPSQPKMFGVEDYVPQAETDAKGVDLIIPAQALGVKLISIGFFIAANDALIWRGPMATNALRQLIHQCDWGVLDFLLIDLPPGTGDVHLTILQELKVDAAIIVSTPQQVAVADVLRGVKMFQAEKVEIPVLGIIENMAWFTPAELPQNKYYLFGHGGAAALARQEGLDLLGEIPIIQSVMEGADAGIPDVSRTNEVSKYYEQIARKVVDKLK